MGAIRIDTGIFLGVELGHIVCKRIFQGKGSKPRRMLYTLAGREHMIAGLAKNAPISMKFETFGFAPPSADALIYLRPLTSDT